MAAENTRVFAVLPDTVLGLRILVELILLVKSTPPTPNFIKSKQKNVYERYYRQKWNTFEMGPNILKVLAQNFLKPTKTF